MQTLNHKYFLLKRKKQSRTTQSVAWFMACLLATFHVQADNLTLPTDPVIAAGDINITSALGQMQINQASQSGIINWQSFSIGRDASVNFQQPSANAITLNRVTGGSPSSIFGQMSANGNIFLVNPSGILFGRGSMVDVGLIVASVSDITDQNFLSGHYEFTRTSNQPITNQGSIKGEAVALIGPDVRNEGTIVATLGDVALVSGKKVTVALDPNRKLSIAVDESSLAAFIENSGDMKAESGTVILKARSSQDLVDQTINMPQSANAFVTENGVVRLVSTTGQIKAKTVVVDAGPGGASFINGTIDVSSLQDVGGQITLTGKEVTLGSLSRLKAQGLNGGGKILVGGDWQGSHGVFQSTYNTIHQGAVLDASASGFGNGGTIVAWSDISNPLSITRAYGNFIADAGILGGNGGMIETSGHRLLTDDIMVSAASSFGNGGEWLLDPFNVSISTASNSGTSFTSGTDFTALETSVINVSNINSALNTGTNVSISTGSQSDGTITVNGSILKSAGAAAATLTLTGANIILGPSGTSYSITASGTGVGPLSVTLNSLPSAPSYGVSSYADMDLGGGTFTLNNDFGSYDHRYRGKILGNTALVKSGSSWLYLHNNENTFYGGITLTNGLILTQSEGSLGLGNNISITGAAYLWINHPSTVGVVTIGSGGGDIRGSSILTGTSYTISHDNYTTITAILAGSGALTKSGSGTLTLSGANTYTGTTTISAGTLNLGSAQNGNTSGPMGIATSVGSIVMSGGVLQYSATNTTDYSSRVSTDASQQYKIDTNSQTVTWLSNLTSSGGTLTKSGSGTLTLSGANTYTGTTTISAGTLKLGASDRIADASALVVTGTFDLNGFSETVGSIAGAGTGTITSSASGTLTLTAGSDNTSTTFSGLIQNGSATSVALTKSGSGTLTLEGANTYTGTTTISAGTLKLGAASRIADASALVVTGTFDLNRFSETVGSIAGAGTITSSASGTLTLTAGGLNTSTTFSGLIQNGSATTVALTKSGSGTLTLSGANTYTGATTISAGTLSVTGTLGSGTYAGAIANAGTLSIGTTTQTLSGIISGVGALTKEGSGTWTLSGANTYTGLTTISAGTLAYGRSDALSSGAVTVGTTR
ncbi:FhaB Large exoproteins involved in heme utilization or adhesion [Methylophilaceae bacterium]